MQISGDKMIGIIIPGRDCCAIIFGGINRFLLILCLALSLMIWYKSVSFLSVGFLLGRLSEIASILFSICDCYSFRYFLHNQYIHIILSINNPQPISNHHIPILTEPESKTYNPSSTPNPQPTPNSPPQ